MSGFGCFWLEMAENVRFWLNMAGVGRFAGAFAPLIKSFRLASTVLDISIHNHLLESGAKFLIKTFHPYIFPYWDKKDRFQPFLEVKSGFYTSLDIFYHYIPSHPLPYSIGFYGRFASRAKSELSKNWSQVRKRTMGMIRDNRVKIGLWYGSNWVIVRP